MKKETYSLRKLQMAYLPITMKKQVVEQQDQKCLYCWTSNCEHEQNDVKTDAFINHIHEYTEAVNYNDQLQFA